MRCLEARRVGVGFLFAAGLLLVATGVRAEADVVLKDGRTLEGARIELRGDVYLLETGPDSVLSIPWQLVRQIRLRGGDTRAPTGMRVTKAQVLEGPDVPPSPGRREQLEAFGRPPATFPYINETRWHPQDGLGKDVTEFNPARWYTPQVDPYWKPESAFSAAREVTEFSPARWYKPPITAMWHPRDGFNDTVWFPPVLSPQP